MSMGRMNISYVPGVGWKRAGDEIYRGRVTRRVLRSVGHCSLRRVTPRVIIVRAYKSANSFVVRPIPFLQRSSQYLASHDGWLH